MSSRAVTSPYSVSVSEAIKPFTYVHSLNAFRLAGDLGAYVAEMGGEWQRRSAERDYYQLLAPHLHASHFAAPADESSYASPCHALGAQSWPERTHASAVLFPLPLSCTAAHEHWFARVHTARLQLSRLLVFSHWHTWPQSRSSHLSSTCRSRTITYFTVSYSSRSFVPAVQSHVSVTTT